ncbi:MAG: hypothetical protein R2836_04170 [Chitinophagales bacterium]
MMILFAFSCNHSKQSSSSETKEEITPQNNNAWTRQDYRPTKDLQLPSAYQTYLLDAEIFQKMLDKGAVELPTENGMASFSVAESNTMSDEMRKKFPNLNSYKGVDVNNKLCQCTIDKKDTNYSITIFCNDKTLYVKDLFRNEIYFVYNKKDVPPGVGTVNE